MSDHAHSESQEVNTSIIQRMLDELFTCTEDSIVFDAYNALNQKLSTVPKTNNEGPCPPEQIVEEGSGSGLGRASRLLEAVIGIARAIPFFSHSALHLAEQCTNLVEGYHAWSPHQPDQVSVELRDYACLVGEEIIIRDLDRVLNVMSILAEKSFDPNSPHFLPLMESVSEYLLLPRAFINYTEILIEESRRTCVISTSHDKERWKLLVDKRALLDGALDALDEDTQKLLSSNMGDLTMWPAIFREVMCDTIDPGAMDLSTFQVNRFHKSVICQLAGVEQGGGSVEVEAWIRKLAGELSNMHMEVLNTHPDGVARESARARAFAKGLGRVTKGFLDSQVSFVHESRDDGGPTLYGS